MEALVWVISPLVLCLLMNLEDIRDQATNAM